MDIEIRDFSGDDEAAVQRLLSKHAWAERYIEGQVATLAELAQESSGFTAVSILQESLVGFVSAQFYDWNHLAQIHGLAVDPERGRRAIGTRLVGAAEEFARAQGARGIYADTPVDNSIAQSFYLANGYAEGYVMPRYYSDDLDGVTFIKFFVQG